MSTPGLQELKVMALAVDDLARAENFYRTKLDLQPATAGGNQPAFALGNAFIMLKQSGDDWPGRPSAQLNPRLTIAVEDALRTEDVLLTRGVTISDAVQLYEEGQYYVGAFLDSEGNKLWFCSAVNKP